MAWQLLQACHSEQRTAHLAAREFRGHEESLLGILNDTRIDPRADWVLVSVKIG